MIEGLVKGGAGVPWNRRKPKPKGNKGPKGGK